MKKLLPAFLLLVICISHLNLLDAVVHISSIASKDNKGWVKSFPKDEETEKEEKGKEKNEEQEKVWNYHPDDAIRLLKPISNETFFAYDTPLHIHPYTDDDIKPPCAA